jgi:membrane protein
MNILPRSTQAVQIVLLGAIAFGAMSLLRRTPDSLLQVTPAESKARIAGPSAKSEWDRGPSEVLDRGWKGVARRVYQRFNSDRIQAVSAGVAFYGILAIFPAIAALVSIYSLAADPGVIDQHVNDFRGLVPDGALDIIDGQVKRIAQSGHGALGFTAIVSLLVSFWSANSGVKAVFDALDVAYEARETRGFIALNLQSMAFTGGALLFMALALSGIVVLPVLLQYVGLDEKTWYIALARWPALLLIVMLSLAMLYRFGPNRAKPKWRWVTWGSAFAAILWLAASGLFSWYVASFGSYNATYGSLGAVVGFMTWIWISTLIILLGAELNAEIERDSMPASAAKNTARLGRQRVWMREEESAFDGTMQT